MNNALERNDLGDLLYAYVAAVVMTPTDWYDPTVPLEIKLRPQFVIKTLSKVVELQ
jgi:hypothetical protein